MYQPLFSKEGGYEEYELGYGEPDETTEEEGGENEEDDDGDDDDDSDGETFE